MSLTSVDIIAEVMEREGGFVNDPDDSGGPTNHGVTLAMLSAWRGTACSAKDVQNLSALEASQILTHEFVVKPRFDLIADPFLLGAVVDAGINHGPTRPVHWLQEALRAHSDGIMGPATAAAVNGADPHHLAAKFLAARVRFYGRDETDHPSQAKFAAGWADRVASFIERL
jgi:lysozyme family protein